MENKEIEVRFLNIDKSALVEKLIAIGAQDKNEILLSETIFYDPDLSWLEERRFVRIRKSGETIKFTYKENKDQTIDSAFEIEFEISDKKEAEKFLEKGKDCGRGKYERGSQYAKKRLSIVTIMRVGFGMVLGKFIGASYI